MADKKERSRFWVVSTHVLTTGFAMPLLGALGGLFVGNFLSLFLFLLFGFRARVPLVLILSVLGFLAVGYAIGAIYSLSYIRQNAKVENPRSCIWPSIITFAVLALGPYAGFAILTELRFVFTAIALLYFLGIIVCFSLLTRRGFNQMAEEQAEAAE